jgi:hypothetical protein
MFRWNWLTTSFQKQQIIRWQLRRTYKAIRKKPPLSALVSPRVLLWDSFAGAFLTRAHVLPCVARRWHPPPLVPSRHRHQEEDEEAIHIKWNTRSQSRKHTRRQFMYHHVRMKEKTVEVQPISQICCTRFIVGETCGMTVQYADGFSFTSVCHTFFTASTHVSRSQDAFRVRCPNEEGAWDMLEADKFIFQTCPHPICPNLGL